MTDTIPTGEALADAIAVATRAAVRKLFAGHPERFYYLSLITSGEAHAPFLAAWSHEALDRALAEAPGIDAGLLKWSYADSPYMCFGEEYFAEVRRLFDLRPALDHTVDISTWLAECEVRLGAMERALARLDREGLFGTGEARLGLVINAEVVPPDAGNTARARRLNPEGTLAAWLGEAAG